MVLVQDIHTEEGAVPSLKKLKDVDLDLIDRIVILVIDL
jgi:hypothetical protein